MLFQTSPPGRANRPLDTLTLSFSAPAAPGPVSRTPPHRASSVPNLVLVHNTTHKKTHPPNHHHTCPDQHLPPVHPARLPTPTCARRNPSSPSTPGGRPTPRLPNAAKRPSTPATTRVLAHPGHHPLHHLPPGKPPPHQPARPLPARPSIHQHPAPRVRLFIRRRPIWASPPRNPAPARAPAHCVVSDLLLPSLRSPPELTRASAGAWPCCLGTRPTLGPRAPPVRRRARIIPHPTTPASIIYPRGKPATPPPSCPRWPERPP